MTLRRWLIATAVLLACIYQALAEFASFQVDGTPYTWNPSDKAAAIVLSNGNYTATLPDDNFGVTARAYRKAPVGAKRYFELTAGGPSPGAGVATAAATLSVYLGAEQSSIGWFQNLIQSNSIIPVADLPQFQGGDVLGVAINDTANLIWVRVKSGISPCTDWNNIGSDDPATDTGGIGYASLGGAFYPAMSADHQGDGMTLNLGPNFACAAPSGYSRF